MISAEEYTQSGREVAIIGMACRAPGVFNTAGLWRLSKSGAEGITSYSRKQLQKSGVSEEDLDNPNYVMRRGQFRNKNLFDAPLFSYSSEQAKALDPQFTVFSECVWEALEHAGVYEGRIGVYAASADSSNWYNKIKSDGSIQIDDQNIGTMCAQNYLSARISFNHNLYGPSQNVQTACSSSLVAVHLVQTLR